MWIGGVCLRLRLPLRRASLVQASAGRYRLQADGDGRARRRGCGGGLIHTSYDYSLVFVSVAAACMAAYSALSLSARMLAAEPSTPAYYRWLISSALVMGAGIWAMHFIAMLAFNTGVAASYQIDLTVLSMLFAVVGTAAAFWMFSRRNTAPSLLAAGLFMGAAIVSMHYTGMAAYSAAVDLSYSPALVALSAVIAVAASTTALWTAFRAIDVLATRAVASLLLGSAVSGMHYTGMAALTVTPGSEHAHQFLLFDSSSLAVATVAAVLSITAVSVVATRSDRQLAAAEEMNRRLEEAKLTDASFRVVVENAPNGIVMVDGEGRVQLMNRSAERMFGYARAELIGHPIESLVPLHHRAAHPRLRADYWGAPESRAMGAGRELAAQRKDGSAFPVEIGLTPLDTPMGRQVMATIIDISERRKAEAHNDLLLHELSHRVKNNMAVVQSIAAMTAKSVPSASDFVEIFAGRLGALANAHTLLAESSWQHADLHALLQSVIAPFHGDSVFSLSGERMLIPPSHTSTLSLAVHELATNSAKYGALAAPFGHVAIEWHEADGQLVMTWSETDGPPILVQPTREGFGTTMIRRLITTQLGGSIDLRFDPAGLFCTISVPLA